MPFGLSYLNIAGIAAIGLILVGAFWYYNHTQAELQIYAANQAKLEQALQLQQAQIQDLVSKTNLMIENNKTLQSKISSINTESKKISRLINTVSSKDATDDPKKMEYRINQGTNNIFGQLTKIGAQK